MSANETEIPWTVAVSWDRFGMTSWFECGWTRAESGCTDSVAQKILILKKILGFLGPYPPYSMDSPRTIQNLCRIYWARFPICGPLNPSVIDLYPHLPLKQHSYENGSLLVDLRTEWAMASSRLHRSPGWDWQSVQSAGPGIELLQNSPKFYAFCLLGLLYRKICQEHTWKYDVEDTISQSEYHPFCFGCTSMIFRSCT